jgi:hypothetical protein
MRISVFFDGYLPNHEFKDPGQIPLGLLETGINSEIITIHKKELNNYNPKFSILQEEKNKFYKENFWSKNDSDLIIMYTWLSDSYTPILEKMKSGGKRVFIKSDCDGLVGYPLPNRYTRVPILESGTIRLSIMLRLLWRFPLKSHHSKIAAKIIRQVELSDGVLIESPEALLNLNYFLSTWKREDLTKKTYFIPNPVTPEFISSEISNKENIVISYGRWNDFKPKNTTIMTLTIVKFLKERPDYKAIIFGTGTEKIKELIKDTPETLRNRIQILGPVEHKKVVDFLTSAKIFFQPSRWEGFSIAAGEAVCMGCSVVGTPLESLKYLSMQGFSGTISSTFEGKTILAALLQDSRKWEKGTYEPEKIAAFWRDKLNRKTVAESLAKLANTVIKESDIS